MLTLSKVNPVLVDDDFQQEFESFMCVCTGYSSEAFILRLRLMSWHFAEGVGGVCY